MSSLIKRFQFIPVLKFPHLEPGYSPAVEFLTMMTGNVLSLGVQLSVPIVVTLLLTDLFFGLINRVAPQVNVFFLSLPVKMWLGLFVVAVMLPFLVSRMMDYFKFSHDAFEFMIQYFSRMYH